MTNEQAKKMLKAKLECLKRETSGTDFDCNNSNCDECSLCYEQGNMGEQKEALDMAIKALEQKPYEKFESAKDHIYKLAGDYKCWDNRLTKDEAVELCHILEQQPCEDAISRQAAIDALGEKPLAWTEGEYELGLQNQWQSDVDALNGLPSAQQEAKEIGYAECANAMLKMWIDNVLTDGEYNRVMDRLNAHHNAGRRRAESEEV